MEEVANGLPTKSAKIRALAQAGFKNAAIARFLGIRDQHVSNVLRQGLRKNSEVQTVPTRHTVKLGPEGRIVIPAEYRRALSLGEGDDLIVTLEGEALRLISRDAAIRELQAEVARRIPKSVDLVADLIAERRREAAREERDG
jgi:AbrB family looped-hinge helix DNA binding protein